ncbi:LacI family DNA-binding transcriptional regulator [uncultured Roseibium sp.]|uniref:LacI family DNA-binding transcriptional regulator n=1 Tax=uncultured Roseibium sp. TaxID=1936171 RepID=UPI002612FF3A|nr:LacI family DNA-binding transcriptional regulator [uncultured Roseibium sp.]
MAKLKDIAEIVGTSIATVSRVLNRDATISVSPKTRARIVAVAEELDYKPLKERRNIFAAGRGSYRSKVSEIYLELGERWKHVSEGSYYSRLKNGVERRCLELDVHVVTVKCLYPELFQPDGKTRGAIVVGQGSGIHRQARDFWQNLIVFADFLPEEPDFDSVGHDLYSATEQLMTGLTSKGYRRIGFIGGCSLGEHPEIYEARFKAYKDWLGTKDSFDSSLVSLAGNTTDNGLECTRELLAVEPRPDAIVACTDDMAVGAYKAVRDAGLTIAQDVAVVGFNDNPASELLDPALASVRLAPEEIGTSAVNQLLERLSGRDIAKKVVIQAPIIWRNSVK